MTYLQPNGTIKLRPQDDTFLALDPVRRMAAEHLQALNLTKRDRIVVWPDAPPLTIPGEGERGLSGMLFGEGARDGWGLAQLCGWHCVHMRDSRRQDIEGWPDWVCIREAVIYIELKRQRDELRLQQVSMAARLIAAGAHYYLVRPSDWAAIGAVLIDGPTQKGV